MARSARYVQKILTYLAQRKYSQKNSLKLQEIKLKCFYTVFICKVRVEIFANKYHSF